MTPSLSKPLIVLTCSLAPLSSATPTYQVKQAYVNALAASGAEPVLLPSAIPVEDLEALAERFDGFLFTGGADMDPSIFGGPILPSVYGIDPQRDLFEMALARLLVKMDKPLLAICRGLQVLNVALGGDLVVDIATQLPSALKHDWYPSFARDKLVHQVFVEVDSKLAGFLGKTNVKTNSLHHQAIQKLGEGLKINAKSEDGIIEGVEMADKKFIVGVQWHPECLQADLTMRQIFTAFTSACSAK